ncbi:hypothetical protein [Thermococcus thermotolerans]|uniref:hypothetical protein n=1 Tax=Thermococcus thermotolerans TaxID=2969672 RepID=UPI002157D0DF|nr:hypothetical protein [Thermococcus thermotolerans]
MAENTLQQTHTPILNHKEFAIISEHHADSAAYETLIGGVHQIFEAHSKKTDPGDKTEKILEYIVDTFGKKNGEEFVYLSDSEPKRLEQYDKKPVIILQPFDSAADALEKELAQKMIDEIEFQERVLTKNEKEKIQKAAKLIIRAAKKMKKLMEDRPVWDYNALADAQARLYKQPHLLAREAAEILGIDPLEHFQEEIMELAKMFPKTIKPEKTYGDRWYEFLKKKGIGPEGLNPGRREKPEKQKTREHVPAKVQNLLGILNGLKFADYSENAIQKAIRSLELEVERLSKNPMENLELIGLYCLVIRALENGDFGRAEEMLKDLSGRYPSGAL